ncbi:MAG: T9SS type A sorting domain-containing protein [Draconibacterium sp.]|nr:T9SS type A sorting domain-containing protein [Draconibacterium sp.]
MTVKAQTTNKTVQLNVDEKFQEITGFGASLAYYENWLTAHPKRAEIYDVIFKELSLDILRFRNAHGYDAGMMDRVKEFAEAAEQSLGHPIDILVTSWGPPAYLKSNNNRKNGGTIKYTVANGKVEFDYDGFAQWWNESLDNYNENGIYPTYLSIQNEPDFKATWESCLLRPTEVINTNDTIAGYNKALEAVYDTVMTRESPPKFVGPECIGIGYNAVEKYINALDLSKLHAIGHHLYHGAEGGTVENDPFTSSNYKKVGNFHPEIPHFQTEYSRADWFSLAGMIFQSLAQENVKAFLYWDLIWSDGGLVNLHFPWDRNRWTNSKGYNRTKEFYVFKHYSAFIHPGWKRIATSQTGEQLKTTAFISSSGDSASFVAVNRSETDTIKIRLQVPGYKIEEANVFTTSEENNFQTSSYLNDTLLYIPPKSIQTADLRLSQVNTSTIENHVDHSLTGITNYPNPFTQTTSLQFISKENADFLFSVYNTNGQLVSMKKIGIYSSGKHIFTFSRNGLDSGVYIYQLKSSKGNTKIGKFIIAD